MALRPLDLLLVALIAAHVLLCPYTKVEESFNLQATHDIVNYGIIPDGLTHYDHFEFPGVVPRTFLGALSLGLLTWPVLSIVRLLAATAGYTYESLWTSRFLGQYVARLFLGLSTALALSHLRCSVRKAFGDAAAVAFVFITCCQFHTIFWTSRTLPNMFAFPLVILALSHYLALSTSGSAPLRRAIRLMTFTAVVFRFEVALLLGPILLLEWLWFRCITFREMALDGIVTSVLALATTIAVDSYFWGSWPMWPEGAVFWFNGVEGKSVKWGILPFHAYFSTFLPRLLLVSIPLAVYACVIDPRPRRLLVPATIFVTLFSLLGHKEWRFVVYVVPMFNIAASIGVSRIYIRSLKSIPYRILLALVSLSLLASFIASTMMAWISSHNYPGGHALHRLHELRWDAEDVRVHMDAYTAMTGASRFGELKEGWSYSKNETHVTPASYTAANYTHLLTSTPALHQDDYAILDVIKGYDGVKIKHPRDWVADVVGVMQGKENLGGLVDRVMPVRVLGGEKVWVMERKWKCISF